MDQKVAAVKEKKPLKQAFLLQGYHVTVGVCHFWFLLKHNAMTKFTYFSQIMKHIATGVRVP